MATVPPPLPPPSSQCLLLQGIPAYHWNVLPHGSSTASQAQNNPPTPQSNPDLPDWSAPLYGSSVTSQRQNHPAPYPPPSNPDSTSTSVLLTSYGSLFNDHKRRGEHEDNTGEYSIDTNTDADADADGNTNADDVNAYGGLRSNFFNSNEVDLNFNLFSNIPSTSPWDLPSSFNPALTNAGGLPPSSQPTTPPFYPPATLPNWRPEAPRATTPSTFGSLPPIPPFQPQAPLPNWHPEPPRAPAPSTSGSLPPRSQASAPSSGLISQGPRTELQRRLQDSMWKVSLVIYARECY